MRSDHAFISARNLNKTYRLFNHPGDRIKQFLSLGMLKAHRRFSALKDISFDICKGDKVGIIGRNGAGKSTLLQIICGILKPTTGHIRVGGRISALLELGAGFNSEFTGRENVYFQGAVMGVPRKEMDRRFEEIAAFADIGEYVDQPVRTYSNGMFVRLAFASMIHADADILVIDEALAVGDEAFQRKCFAKLVDYLQGSDKILLFVSHNIRQVERICERAVWLEEGRLINQGDARDVCSAYQRRIHEYVQGAAQKPVATVADSGEVVVNNLQLLNDAGDNLEEVQMHASLRLVIDFTSHEDLVAPDIMIGFQTLDSVSIATTNTAMLPYQPDFLTGRHRIEIRVADVILLPGVYQLRLGFLDNHFRAMWAAHNLNTFRVVAPAGSSLVRLPPGIVDMPFEWHFPSVSD